MNEIDVGLSFIEGLALILSPCILPILPLVLSTSVGGGKGRPFGIIGGFVIAFSAFVLASRQIVDVLHIDIDIIRNVSLVLLFVLGLTLLSEKLTDLFGRLTQKAADFGGKFSSGSEGGFTGGLVVGAFIGLVWTPCAGPIFATVLVQAIRQQTNVQSVFVTMAFAIGAGIPMLVIALVGRKLLVRFGFLEQHASALRKTLAILILASVAYLGFGSDIQTLFQSRVEQRQTTGRIEYGILNPFPAPELKGIQGWLNSPPLVLSDLKGKVVLVDFWTYSCINCVRTLPYLTAWDRRYRDQGLVIIGVHAPEFEFEKNIDNIKTAIARYGINYPVAVDNNLETWLAFNNRYWPAHYLINKSGQIVYTHFGEGDYSVTENNIRVLLGLTGKAETYEEQVPYFPMQTPETYLGLARAERYVGTPYLHAGDFAVYQPAPQLSDNEWTLGGKWKIESKKIVAEGSDAVLKLKFMSSKVYLVMGSSTPEAQKITVTLNGKPLGGASGKDVHDGFVIIDRPTLYELVAQGKPQQGLLEIKAMEAGFEAYAFTFGN